MAPTTKIWVFWRVLSRLFACIFRQRWKPPFLVNRNFLAYSPPHKQLGTTGPAERISRVSVSQLGGSGGMLARENLTLKSSEMARNASKTAKSEVNF